MSAEMCDEIFNKKIFFHIRHVNGVKLADILFSLLSVCLSVRLCVCALSPVFNSVLFAEECIQLVYEKLTTFSYGQYIVGIYVSSAF